MARYRYLVGLGLADLDPGKVPRDKARDNLRFHPTPRRKELPLPDIGC